MFKEYTQEEIEKLSITIKDMLDVLNKLNPNCRLTISKNIYYGDGEKYERPFTPIRDGEYPNLYIIGSVDGMP